MAKNRTSFKTGNKIGVTGGDHSSRKFITQQLISRLHEVMPRHWRKDRRMKGLDLSPRYRILDALIDRMIENSARYGENDSIKFIVERVEGKLPIPAGENDDANKEIVVTIRGGLPTKPGKK